MTTLVSGHPTETWDRLRAGIGGRMSRLPGALGQIIRRHWGLWLLLLAGGVLRILVMTGYNPGFWYHGDSQSYLAWAYHHRPGTVRPYGYSYFLGFLLEQRSVRQILALQHVMGIALAAASYAFLQRRGVSRVVSLLAVAPLLLDARTVALEHFLLSETLFTTLIVVGMLALGWRQSPGWLACLLAAGVFSWAALTRSVGLPALAVPLLYLILRRVSWLKIVAFVAVVGTALGGYLVWYHSFHGEYSFGTYGSRFLWSRTTTFVNCDVVDLTAEERQLCPTEPLGERLPPDLYLWNGSSANARFKGPRYDPLFGSFARKVIRAQPGEYALTIAKDTWLFVRPGTYPSERVACVASLWVFPVTGQKTCEPNRAPHDPAKRWYAGVFSERHHPLMKPLHAYAGIATVPAIVLALCFLLALGLAFFRPRASTWRDHLDPLAWTGLGFGFIVVSVATSAIDPRYAVPSLPLAVVGAALAWRRFRAARAVGAGSAGEGNRQPPAGDGGQSTPTAETPTPS